MNAPSKLALFVAALAISAPQAATAKVMPSKQWNGTWKLNLDRSKFSTPSDKRSETRTYKINGMKVSMKSQGTDADGKSLNFSYDAAYDGKWYRFVGSPYADRISLRLDSPRHVRSKSTYHGKPAGNATAILSADGKQLTITRHTLRPKPTTDVLAFDKQ